MLIYQINYFFHHHFKVNLFHIETYCLENKCYYSEKGLEYKPVAFKLKASSEPVQAFTGFFNTLFFLLLSFHCVICVDINAVNRAQRVSSGNKHAKLKALFWHV